MAYYIFLKSLRSLEEFRKKSHIKIPPKCPSTNLQSLGKFKNPIFNSEIPFSLTSARPTLRPTRPLAQPARWPCCPRRPKPPRPAHLARMSVASSREYIFSFGSRLPRGPPLPRLSDNRAPAVSSIPHLQPPELAAPPPLPGHRAPPRSTPRVPPDRYHLAFIFPPLILLLNPPPSSMVLKSLTPALSPPATPPRRSPDPYKR
jgi:hypothetical protein